jgi:protein involved in polysaccharide export with SLBB domain
LPLSTNATAQTNQAVWVSGEVIHPGRFTWTAELTFTNAIELAGGMTPFAGGRQAKIQVRHSDGTVKRYSYQQAVGTGTNAPVVLDPNDRVVVLRRIW